MKRENLTIEEANHIISYGPHFCYLYEYCVKVFGDRKKVYDRFLTVDIFKYYKRVV